jgi:hypothetical protein
MLPLSEELLEIIRSVDSTEIECTLNLPCGVLVLYSKTVSSSSHMPTIQLAFGFMPSIDSTTIGVFSISLMG